MKANAPQTLYCGVHIQLNAGGDSGFAAPEFYDLFKDNDEKYTFRLKINSTLLKLAHDEEEKVIDYYRNRGRMENFIGVGKRNSHHFSSFSHVKKVTVPFWAILQSHE